MTLSVVVAGPALASPTLSLESTAVRWQGSTPSGQVAIFGFNRSSNGIMVLLRRVGEVVESDAAGEAVLELDFAVPPIAIWAAIDLTTGEVALAAPVESGVRQVSFPKRGVGATRRFLEDGRRFLDLMLVRPVTAVPADQDAAAVAGVWSLAYGDGSERDGDGAQDGRVRALLDQLQPVGTSPPPPAELASGDVVVVVDPTTFEIFTAKLAL